MYPFVHSSLEKKYDCEYNLKAGRQAGRLQVVVWFYMLIPFFLVTSGNICCENCSNGSQHFAREAIWCLTSNYSCTIVIESI